MKVVQILYLTYQELNVMTCFFIFLLKYILNLFYCAYIFFKSFKNWNWMNYLFLFTLVCQHPIFFLYKYIKSLELSFHNVIINYLYLCVCVCVCVFHSFFTIYIFLLGCFKPRGHQVVLELGGRGGGVGTMLF